MEDSAVKMIILGISVLVVCGLISLIFINFNAAQDLAISSYDSMRSVADEYKSTEIRTLESSDVTGATVVSMIRKYQDQCNVHVRNTKSSPDLVYNSTDHFTNNTESSFRYVSPSASYKCKTVYNANGILTDIYFIKRGLETIEDITSIDDAKVAIWEALPLTVKTGKDIDTVTWFQIADFVESACVDADATIAKQRIIDSGFIDSTFTISSTWENILDALFAKCNQLAYDNNQLRERFGTSDIPYKQYLGTLHGLSSGLSNSVSCRKVPDSATVTVTVDGRDYVLTYMSTGSSHTWVYTYTASTDKQFTYQDMNGNTQTLNPGDLAPGIVIFQEGAAGGNPTLMNLSGYTVTYDFYAEM